MHKTSERPSVPYDCIYGKGLHTWFLSRLEAELKDTLEITQKPRCW